MPAKSPDSFHAFITEMVHEDFYELSVRRDPSAPAASRWTNPDAAQFLADIFDESDPRSAQEQAMERYAHGGGWRPVPGFTVEDADPVRLLYPGDRPLSEVSICCLQLTGQILILFEYSFIAIVEPDGSYEVARMD